MERRKRYSRKFQRMAVERMRTCESVDELAKELGVTRRYSTSGALKRKRLNQASSAPSTHASARKSFSSSACSPRRGGGVEVDFLKGARKNKNSTPTPAAALEGIYEQIRELMPLRGRLSIEHMCQLVAVSAGRFYRSLPPNGNQRKEETEVRSVIPADRSGTSPPLRLSTDHCRTAPPRRAGEPQAGGTDDVETIICWPFNRNGSSSLRMQSISAKCAEPGKSHDADGDQPALGRRHPLCSLERRVCLPWR